MIKQKNRFNKVLGINDVVVMAFGAMIGWGWVVSSGQWIQNAGVFGTVIGFIIGGFMIYFVGQAYAELTTAMPKCGGEHIFSYKAFGPLGSFICTWAIILSYIGVVCFEACSLPTIIQYIYPQFLQGYLYTIAGFDVYLSWLLCAVVVAIVITLVNIKGVKAAANLQKILTILIATVGLILIAISAINGSPSNLNNQIFIGDNQIMKFENILSVATVAPFFLLGFDVIPQIAEEINVPLKKIGKLLIFSIFLAVIFYTCVALAIGLAMNVNDVTISMAGGGLVAADAMEKMFNSDIMAKVLIIGGICGIITSWNSFLIGGSRAIFSMAETYMIPRCFSKLHKRYKTPINSLLLIGILSIISPLFGKEMLTWIANSSSFACCIAYLIVSLSFIKLRKTEPNLKRPYRVKNYKFVGISAVVLSSFMIAMYIIPNTSSTLSSYEWIICGGWILLGMAFAIFGKYVYKEKFGSNFELDKE